METETINVCICIDKNYVEQAKALIRSIIFYNVKGSVRIFVVTWDNSEDITLLEKLHSENVRVIVKKIEIDNDLSKLEAGGHISPATYIRLGLAESFYYLDKILYLDSDLIVQDDLADLWQTDVTANPAAAVLNPFFNRYQELTIRKNSLYFNAGVLLINLRLWRDLKVKKNCLDVLNKRKSVCVMFDQDALNIVLNDKVKELDTKWNVQTSYIRNIFKFRNDKNLTRKILNPSIIHYSSSSKPWEFLDPHPFRKKFIQYYTGPIQLKSRTNFFYFLKAITKYMFWKFNFIFSKLKLKFL